MCSRGARLDTGCTVEPECTADHRKLDCLVPHKQQYRERKCAENYSKQHNTFIFRLKSAFWQFQTITVSECCSIKLLPYILFDFFIYILVVEMASAWNQDCANIVSVHVRSL